MSKIVKRTLDFFELFAQEARPLTLSDISRITGVPMSSCSDVIRTLQERGYLYELGDRAGYYPTSKLTGVAGTISKNDPILLRAGFKLRELREQTGETVSLAHEYGNSVIYLAVLESHQRLKFSVQVGEHARSLYGTSAGKAFLSTKTEEEVRSLLGEGPLAPLTPNTITDIDALLADLEETRRLGYAVNCEESVPTAITITSWFQWFRRNYFITVAGPSFSMASSIDETAQLIVQACRELEQP